MSSNIVHRLRTWSSKQIFIVFAAFLVYFLADGVTFSFGLYVDELIREYSETKSNTVLSVSTIAALTQSVPLLLSPFVCWWTTKFGASSASLIGCILSFIGYCFPFIFQFNKTFWIPATGYGCLLSVGLAFCYVPAYLTLPFYFENDRGLATGLAVSGSGVGQVALSIIIKACIIEYGWRSASFITGTLFLFMLISVFAFRQPTTSARSSLPTIEINEISTNPLTTITVNNDFSREDEPSIAPSQPRRSRGMTIAQVLPLFISSVPIRAGITIPSIESMTVSPHLSNTRPRNFTVCTEPLSNRTTTITDFQRTRAKTIAVPLPTVRKFDGSLERIYPSTRPLPLAPIASSEENIDEEKKSLSPSSSLLSFSVPPVPLEQIDDQLEKSSNEKHWLLNSRFLLFCLSNFTLCLVMGVPYVIIPRYISETFRNEKYLGSWILSNVGIASAVGQILLGYLHDRKIFPAWIMYTLAVIISGISLIILPLFHYKSIILLCGFMYGLAISANYALQMLIIIDAVSIDNMSNAFGILQFCQGISTLIGIPLQGLLRDVTRTYKLPFLTSGFIIILSGISMVFWPCFKTTNKKKMYNINNDE
ncbi:unnamed protein product [Adineta steineri]|uniref:Major facilitator superfamily (MFS) profile domain-containing protein n=1 Tax=Adineta steineri TaxID=433720 RepID=A0A818GK86_9BILA|nr:unnamed protein product [Adineta steineri]